MSNVHEADFLNKQCFDNFDHSSHRHIFEGIMYFCSGKSTAVVVDMVNHPPHYTGHPSGIECIQITRHMGFNLGNAFKYIWRVDLKHGATDGQIEDLEKAIWYIQDEIKKRQNGQ